MKQHDVEASAILSPCRTYRYELWRKWGDLFDAGAGYAMFVGLNPSTADETEDDPTIRRCIAFAKAWGYSALCMTNLFAFRATDPGDMMVAANPIGPGNDAHLTKCAAAAGIVVAAWGVNGTFMDRETKVRSLLPNLHYLRLTKAGNPGHPLYLPLNLRPVAWGTK